MPNPLTVEIRRGTADIEQVMRDVMSLTKLNFNGAEFCDGLPITLRFADLVGRKAITRCDAEAPSGPARCCPLSIRRSSVRES